MAEDQQRGRYIVVQTPGMEQPVSLSPGPGRYRIVASATPEEDVSLFERIKRAGESSLEFSEQVGRGILTAPVSVGQGLVELGALGLDAAFDTNTSRGVTDFFEGIKANIKPDSVAGNVTEEVVAFGLGFIPIAGWLGRAGQAAKVAQTGGKIIPASNRFLRSADQFGASAAGQALLKSRARLAGTTALAAGAYDTIFTPEGRPTLSDSLDMMAPLQTEADTGLLGRDEAGRRIRNRLRSGAEAMTLSAGFDALLAGAGAGARAVGRTETAAAAARGLRNGFQTLEDLAARTPGVKRVGPFVTRYFSPSGGADPRVFEETMDSIARIDARETLGFKAYREYERAFEDFLKQTYGRFRKPSTTRVAREEAANRLYRFLTGDIDAMDIYSEPVKKAADRLLNISNQVRDSFITTLERELATAPSGTARADKIRNALDEMKRFEEAEKGFLRRRFGLYENPYDYYKNLNLSGPEYEAAIREVSKNMNGVQWDSPGALALARFNVNKYIGLDALNTGTSPEQAIKEKLEALKVEAAGAPGSLLAKDMPRLRLTPTLLTPREKLIDKSPTLQKLMGVINDPKKLYFDTISDIAKTTEGLRFYQNMSKSGLTASLADAAGALNSGGRPVFVRVPNVDPSAPRAPGFAPRTLGAGTDIEEAFDFGPYMEEAQRLNMATARPVEIEELGDLAALSDRITPFDLIARDENRLKQAGYVKLGEADGLNDVFVGPYGALSGLYVSPETYNAMRAPLRLGINALDEGFSILSQFRALSQKMTIVPSPGTQIRNILGNTLMLSATANLGRTTDIFDIGRLFLANLEELDEAGINRLAKAISLSGVTESNLVVQALKEYANAGADLRLSGGLQKAISKGESFIPFMQAFERLYSDSDSFFKGVAFVSEHNKLAKAFADAGIDEASDAGQELIREMQMQGIAKRTSSAANPELTPLEVMAADAVKDMFPIYNRVGAAVRALDKFPIFGNFTSFASENIRNSLNILQRGVREMSFTIPEELAARMPGGTAAARRIEAEIRARGAERLAAYTATAAIMPKAMVRAAMAATGVTPEQMEMAYSLLPEYFAGNDIVPTGFDGKGNMEYINLSYVSPYAFALDPATAALRAYSEAGRLGKNEAQQILNAGLAGLTSYADPFASESMVYERVRDVLPSEGLTSLGVGRGGRTPTGAIVYNETDNLGDKGYAALQHIIGTFIPGYVRYFEEGRPGELRPGRITRAMLGVPGPQGQEYDLPAELARVITGFTPMELNLRRDFKYSGLEYSPRRTDAKSAATRIIGAPDRTVDEMLSGWSTYLDNLYREQSKLYADIQAARALGLSDQDIRRQLIKDANIGSIEVNTIMRGEFYPANASREMIQDINRQRYQQKIPFRTDDIPFGTFTQMSQQRRGEALNPRLVEMESEAATMPVEPAPPLQESSRFRILSVPGQAPAAEQQPAPAPVVGTRPAPASPQLSQPPAVRVLQSPDLAGSDPISRMRNLEIAQRQAGQ